jgi:uncharacterized Fe-S cluster protein YjdI/CDGSH-type Zn-finger protein
VDDDAAMEISGPTTPRSRTKEYVGEKIAVSFDAERCIHAGACVLALKAVFDRDRRPWIDPSQAEPDRIAAVVETCPSGALHYRRLDGGPAESVPETTTVTVRNNGPLYVRGKITITDPRGNVIVEDTRAALCRCGNSGNKPFCDNSHLKTGFRSAITATPSQG